MEKYFRIGFAAILIGIAVLGWRAFFPSPERVIRANLSELAKIASFQPIDGIPERIAKARKIPDFFTPDVVATFAPRGYAPQTFNNRDELQQAALASGQRSTGLKVEFLDINVTIGPDRQSAVVNMTCRATFAGDRDFYVLELNLTMKKISGEWLIHRVETVKTLSANRKTDRPRNTIRISLPAGRSPALPAG